MQYSIKYWKNINKDLKYGDHMQLGIVANILRQKRKINNSKKYTREEKHLIMKGLDLAIHRTWGIKHEIDLL